MGFFTKRYNTGAERSAAAKEYIDKGKWKKVIALYEGIGEDGLSLEEKYLLAQANIKYWDDHKKETFLNTFLRLNEKAAEEEYLPSMMALAKYYTPESERSMELEKKKLDPEKMRKARHWYEMALAAGCEDSEFLEKYNEVVRRIEKDMDERPFEYFKGEAVYQRIRDAMKRKKAELEQIMQEADGLMEAGNKEEAAKLYREVVYAAGEKVAGALRPMVGKAAYRLSRMASDESVREVKIYEEIFFSDRAYRTHMPEGYLAKGDLVRTRYGKSGADWYKEAVQAGAREAYFWYGLCCYYGLDTAVDYAQAANYLSKVCVEEPRAAYLCGVMHEKGLGVPASKDMAKGFYNMAASKGWNKAYNDKFEAVMEANNSMTGIYEISDREFGSKTHYVTRDGKRVIWSVYGYTYPARDRD